MDRFVRPLVNVLRGIMPKDSVVRQAAEVTPSAKVDKKLFVRCVQHEDRLQAKFTYTLPNGKEKVINMNRLITEPVSDTLTRLKSNISKHSETTSNKKKRKKCSHSQTEAVEWVSVTLTDRSGDPVNSDLHNCHAWSQGSVLIIGSERYLVEVNSPTVCALELPKVLLSTFPVFPTLLTEFAELKDSEFVWSRYKPTTPGSDPKYQVVSRDEFYSPLVDDVGYHLKLECTPKLGDCVGETVAASSSSAVLQSKSEYPFEHRHAFAKSFTHIDSFRILSYNILAEVYTDTDYSRDELFSYCPMHALDYSYRRQLIMREILGYQADIICLQEVDKKHFLNFYQPLLGRYEYMSSMVVKSHKKFPSESEAEATQMITINEGSAVFYRSSKFKLVAHHTMHVPDMIESDPLYEDLFSIAKQSDLVLEKILYRSGTSLQVLVLESVDDPGRKVCVATTHLYFHPLGTAVRLLQAAVSLRFLNHVKSMYRTKETELPVIYCGDFNSFPEGPLVRFVNTGVIEKNNRVWTENEAYHMPGGARLTHHLNLESACGSPPHTNFTPGFKKCIDYIFYEKDLMSVESVVPFPTAEILAAENGGIPSEGHPSDHIPLVATLHWKK